MFLAIKNTPVALGFWIGEYSWYVEKHSSHIDSSHTKWGVMYVHTGPGRTCPTELLVTGWLCLLLVFLVIHIQLLKNKSNFKNLKGKKKSSGKLDLWISGRGLGFHPQHHTHTPKNKNKIMAVFLLMAEEAPIRPTLQR